jgi:hypothetical protein
MPRWRNDSIFGDGPRVPLDRERRAQCRAKMKLQRRPGRLTAGALLVGLALLDMLGNDGRLDPSHKTLAERARVDVATVKRALVLLRACGFVTWVRRLVRSASGGWRTEQTSNAYVLSVPSCEAHFARRVPRKILSSVPRAPAQAFDWREERDRQLRALGWPVPAS